MPRGGGYSSLPGSSDLDHIENRNDTNSNNEASGQIASPGPGTTNLSTASLPIAEIQGGGASFTVPGPEGSPHSKQEGSRGKSTGARNAQEAGDGRGKGDADLTGGLPTAEGVFVGSPIDQSSLYQPGAGMLQHQATVVTSAPPAYGSSRGAAGASAVVTSTDGRPNSSHTVILVNNPGYGEWGRAPQPFACRACGFSGYSNAVQVSSRM